MEAKVVWQGKMFFQAKTGSGHTINMDAKPEVGGENKGARPTELILCGVGGCSGIDIVNILNKMRQEITINVHVSANEPRTTLRDSQKSMFTLMLRDLS